MSVAPTILITDDDREFRETLRGVFEPHGVQTQLAGDGQEALDIVEQSDVHLLLLDMHMPRLTGLETIRRVKLIKSQLPCILMSAALDEMLVQQALLAQAFCVLAKPISSRQLTTQVRLALESTYHWSGWMGGEERHQTVDFRLQEESGDVPGDWLPPET